jgi:hypothetical protein
MNSHGPFKSIEVFSMSSHSSKDNGKPANYMQVGGLHKEKPGFPQAAEISMPGHRGMSTISGGAITTRCLYWGMTGFVLLIFQ